LLVVRDPAWNRPARSFALALSLSTAAAFLLVTPTASRLTPLCDAIGINSAAAVLVAGAGLAGVATFGERWTRLIRLIGLAVAGALALAVFTIMEPRCLRGPFGSIDNPVFQQWLANVSELQGVASLFNAMGAQAFVYIGFPIVAVLSTVLVVWLGLRTPLAWAPVAALAIAAVIAAGQIRMMVYVVWLGLPFVGVAAHRLAQASAHPLPVRVGAAAVLSPPVVSLAILSAVSAFAHPADSAKPQPLPQWAVDASACFAPEHYRAFAALPTGLVMGALEIGPSVLAHTRHSIVAAGYHRAERAIRFNEEVMNGTSAEARARLTARGVDYVVTCRDFPIYGTKDSFFNALLADSAGDWLEPIPLPADNLLKIWRISHQ
jgi:hypothetical protein